MLSKGVLFVKDFFLKCIANVILALRLAHKMPHLIQDTLFRTSLTALVPEPSDQQLRRLIFEYCKLYQNTYGFVQLQNAFAYLDIMFTDGADVLASEFANVRREVEEAMGEYFISLNEVATAIYRLLDPKVLTIADTLEAINHVWEAHACNESPDIFRKREDQILCNLLAQI